MSTPDPNNPTTTTTRSQTQNHSGRTATPPAPPPPAPHQRTLAPFPHHTHYHHHLFPQQPFPVRRPNNQETSSSSPSLLYPFSGRGFPTRPGRPPQSPVFSYHHPHHQRALSGSGHLDPIQFMRAAASNPHHPHHQNPYHFPPPPPQQQQHPVVGPVPSMRGIPAFLQPRAAPPPSSVSESNGHKNPRSRDEALVVVRDRKVRISERASLYALSRSWLRNGVPEQIQPQNGNTVKSLPRPLPPHMADVNLQEKEHGAGLPNEEEDEESVDHLSEKDLLKRHVNRAKKIRARLREERLKRIARYKARLALLLPPMGDQCRND